jgi:hypothetical protein
MNRAELTIISSSQQETFTGKARDKWKAFAGQLWCEWYVHSKLLLSFLAAWLAGVWVLPLFAGPAWILALGGVYALLAGPLFGGADTLEGCEEFTFALAPTRRERYTARLVVGGGGLVVLTALDLLSLGLDLPQILAKLYMNSGLIRPRPIFNAGLLYGLVLTLPLTIFLLSFAFSAVTHSRRLILTASFWSTLASLGVLRLGFWYEDLMWGSINGYCTCPWLALLAFATAWAGARVYAAKEIGQQSAPVALPARWWLWCGLFLLGLLLGLVLAASLAAHWSQLFPG